MTIKAITPMKGLLIIFCSAFILAGVVLAADEKEQTCCEKAAAKGKDCTMKCCVAAHHEGKSCEKCNPHKEDLKFIKKKDKPDEKKGE